MKIWDVNVDNIGISEFVETKNNCKYLIGYLDDFIRPLVLVLPKISGYITTLKNINNKLMSQRMDDDKLLEKYKTIWTKTEGLLDIKLNALPAYDDRYIKTEIRTYGHKVYTNFRCLNVPEDGIKYKFLQSFL